MEIHLLIHNIFFITFVIVTFGLFFFILLNNPRSIPNITFSLGMLSATIFALSHVIGVNVSDPDISRDILMANLAVPFIGIFNAHAVMVITEDGRKKLTAFMILLYTVAIGATLFFLAFPSEFLLPSVPKMYFPDYYNPGVFNVVRLILLYGMAVPYMIYRLGKAYHYEQSQLLRGQFKYFLYAVILGYGLGFIPNFLVYNINIDPLWGGLTGLFAVPLLLGVVKYELLNMKIVAKQAFWYSLSIGVVGGMIALLDYSNKLIQAKYENFPVWITPILSAVIIVTIAVLIWRKMREEDILKYEFVTTVTHKFRTPLTRIKWAADNISKTVLPKEVQTEISYIQDADKKLIELTGELVKMSEAESTDYEYNLERVDISTIVEDAISSMSDQFSSKKLLVSANLQDNVYVRCDISRIRFVIQAIMENALRYTLPSGVVSISATKHDRNITLAVRDTGIGISKEEFPLLFSKFFRGHQAKLSDTEGFGLGLYISKEIISRHKGKIWAESDGVGKGSVFSFSLPAVD